MIDLLLNYWDIYLYGIIVYTIFLTDTDNLCYKDIFGSFIVAIFWIVFFPVRLLKTIL